MDEVNFIRTKLSSVIFNRQGGNINSDGLDFWSDLSPMLSTVSMSLEDLISVKKYCDSLFPVEIRLSFYPSRDKLRSITSKFRSILGSELVLDITIDRSLIGGFFLFGRDGKVFDYSLVRAWEAKVSPLVKPERNAHA
jgi:hypothetical protein